MKLLGFAVVVAPLTLVGIGYSIHSQLTPKPLKSFVVTSVMSSPQAGSPYLLTSTFARAVRIDGSWVTIWTRNVGGQEQYERDIRDYSSGLSTVVDDVTKSVVEETIPVSEYKHRLVPSVSCDGSPAGQILGLPVNYSETTANVTENPQGDATALIKNWVVPDLGCFVLQKETIWTRKSDGALLVDTKLTPISATFREVDEFFQIPTAYAKRTKKEVLDELNQMFP